MRVLLVNPPHINKHGIWEAISSCMPSLGIGYIASYLLQYDNVEVEILDTNALEIAPSEISFHLDGKRFDYIGVTSTTLTVTKAYQVARQLKKAYPRAPVVMGGVHPTVRPEEVLSRPYVDLIVRGEGEITMKELIVDQKPLEEIPGISYRKDGKIIDTPDRPLIENLDELPFPAYHLLPMEKYRPALGAYRRLPAISMLTARGCPGRCTFCYRMFGKRLRCRSARNIADDIMRLTGNYGIKEISFYDDTFTANRQVVEEFCRILLEEKIDISWCSFSRVDCVNEKTLRLMKAAGCHQIMYGVETLNQDVLRNISKKVTLDQVKTAFELTRSAGIDIRATYMLGNPGETAESLKQVIADAIATEPDIALFNITTPFPGTELYEWADKKGYLATRDWDQYDLSTPVLDLPTLSRTEIAEYYRLSHKKFYLRLSYIFKRLLKIRSWLDLKVNFMSFFSFFD
ncbi:MAG: B12-binding domain-containing radical SAM protein [bacterium]